MFLTSSISDDCFTRNLFLSYQYTLNAASCHVKMFSVQYFLMQPPRQILETKPIFWELNNSKHSIVVVVVVVVVVVKQFKHVSVSVSLLHRRAQEDSNTAKIMLTRRNILIFIAYLSCHQYLNVHITACAALISQVHTIISVTAGEIPLGYP